MTFHEKVKSWLKSPDSRPWGLCVCVCVFICGGGGGLYLYFCSIMQLRVIACVLVTSLPRDVPSPFPLSSFLLQHARTEAKGLVYFKARYTQGSDDNLGAFFCRVCPGTRILKPEDVATTYCWGLSTCAWNSFPLLGTWVDTDITPMIK